MRLPFTRKTNLDEVADEPLSLGESESATVQFLNQKTPILLRPRLIDGSYLVIEWAPVALAQTHRFVVAQKDERYFQSLIPIGVENDWPLAREKWLPQSLENLEKGAWGRVVKFGEREAHFGMAGFEFLGNLGVGMHYETMMYCDGSWGRFRDHGTDEFNPDCASFRWFDGDFSDAGAFLAKFSDEDLRVWLRDEAAREKSALHFSLKWHQTPGLQRRAWLPTVERDCGAQVLAVVRWILQSDANLWRRPSPLQGARAQISWQRPRFTIGRDEFAGWLPSSDVASSQARLDALWPFFWRVLKDYEEPKLALQIPGVAAWVEARHDLAQSVEHPTQHEMLEARSSLKDWLETHASDEKAVWSALLNG